ncbi:MAG: hypothetical protein R2877_04155 [Bdellovibrionota bacterium]
MGKASYYYQDGNLLAEMNLDEGALDSVTMLEADGDYVYAVSQEKNTWKFRNTWRKSQLIDKKVGQGSAQTHGQKRKKSPDMIVRLSKRNQRFI